MRRKTTGAMRRSWRSLFLEASDRVAWKRVMGRVVKFDGGRMRCFGATSAQRSVETGSLATQKGLPPQWVGSGVHGAIPFRQWCDLAPAPAGEQVSAAQSQQAQVDGCSVQLPAPVPIPRCPWTTRPREHSSERNHHSCQVVLPRPSLPVPQSNDKMGSVLRDHGYDITDVTSRGRD